MREKEYRLIEKYLLGELSEDEQEAFDKLRLSNPEIEAEYILRKDVNDAIQESDIMSLRLALNEIINTKKQKTRLIKNPFIWSSVAAVFIIVLIIKIVFFNSNTESNVDCFKEYYQTYPPVVNYRNTTTLSEEQESLKIALEKYENSDFNNAELLLKELVNKDSTNTMAKFYLSISFIEQNKFIEAETYLYELTKNNQHLFYEESLWYLVLVYLNNNKTEEAKELLLEIISRNYSYKLQAKKILKSIN